jgi:hypothetical protein
MDDTPTFTLALKARYICAMVMKEPATLMPGSDFGPIGIRVKSKVETISAA